MERKKARPPWLGRIIELQEQFTAELDKLYRMGLIPELTFDQQLDWWKEKIEREREREEGT